MLRPTFDLYALRSFVQGVELGSFARAAERLGRSTSAVSAQLKKLEDQVGAPILRKSGRGTTLTDTGEILLGYARRLLELNDEAASAVRGTGLEGWVRLGLQEDFGETLLPEVLGQFARAHPKVRIEARIARNVELLERITDGSIDLALAWQAGVTSPHATSVGTLPMRWLGAVGGRDLLHADEPLPLVVLDAPCIMRTAATNALDRAGIPWRIAFVSPSLSGVWAAVAAGLGLTVRTRAGLPLSLNMLDDERLPALPELGLALHRADADPAPATRRLGELLLEHAASFCAVQGAS